MDVKTLLPGKHYQQRAAATASRANERQAKVNSEYIKHAQDCDAIKVQGQQHKERGSTDRPQRRSVTTTTGTRMRTPGITPPARPQHAGEGA